MSPNHFILDETGEKIIQVDLLTWAKWFENNDRIVDQETIGRSFVSTIFLGLDHNWGDGPPVLWETMVFGGKDDSLMNRCSGGREQAEAMHVATVRRVRHSERHWLWLPDATEFCFDQFYDLAYPFNDFRKQYLNQRFWARMAKLSERVRQATKLIQAESPGLLRRIRSRASDLPDEDPSK